MMKNLWIDTRLNQEEMAFLNHAISEENKRDASGTLAGNISKSENIEDKDNWFYKTVLKKLTERMFYRNWDNFSMYHIEVEEGIPLPEFELFSFWVNYQKQYEFNPLHNHTGLYSFVVFMKIPTHWKEQHALPISTNSNTPCASDFAFVQSRKDSEKCTPINILLCPQDEGMMLFFPAILHHMVYPFYECEEERVTISGNIRLNDPKKPVEYKEMENHLKMMENSVKTVKKELKWMKKEREKEVQN